MGQNSKAQSGMTQNAYTVTVAKDLADLIPSFMNNRRKELEALRAALSAADFDELRRLGHRMKGAGSSYGFDLVSTVGKTIEDASTTGDTEAIKSSLDAYEDYLAKVEIVYE
jgi:HPt (histidine-containing phosphotransfer) domain-containing protein